LACRNNKAVPWPSASGAAEPALPSYGGEHETSFAMTSKSWISRLGAPLMKSVHWVKADIAVASVEI
jgi:hypothetical protein